MLHINVKRFGLKNPTKVIVDSSPTGSHYSKKVILASTKVLS